MRKSIIGGLGVGSRMAIFGDFTADRRSEMALTADHLIVIGRGRLIADASVPEVVRRGPGGWVQVRSPARDCMAGLLRDHGAAVDAGHDDMLAVHGLTAATVGEVAARHQITLHELGARQASLEETAGAVAAVGLVIILPVLVQGLPSS
jgi:hypothetical protein